MKITVFSKTKKNCEENCFTFLQISLTFGLIEDSQIFIPASAFHLLQCVVLVEIQGKNLTQTDT